MASQAAPPSRRLLLLAPLGVAALGGAAFLTLLGRMKQGTYDPHTLPSMLIGKKLPHFDLPGGDLPGGGALAGLSSAEIEAVGKPLLVNFFASWCIPCVEEAPQLMALKSRGVPIYGIAYKDKLDATGGFLAQNGNPYTKVGLDLPGRVAIDFGVYGVPETYLLDAAGIVRWRWAGALTDEVIAGTLMPMMKAAA